MTVDQAAARAAAQDVDWSSAVRHVVWVPERYREPRVTELVARRMLRCTEASFAQLVDLGLPRTPTGDGDRYDANDVKNAGLCSGTGRTEPEVALRYLLGFMRLPAAELTTPKRWSFSLRLDDVPGDVVGEHRVHRPAPEVFGGWAEPGSGGEGPFLLVRPGEPVTGTLVTAGAVGAVRSAAVRTAFAELLDAGLRWQHLPPALARRPDEAVALGVGDCGVLSATLERTLSAAGYQAHAWHGWTIGLTSVDHGWVEVVDDDGTVKCLDPSYALLARNGLGAGDYADLAAGSTVNQIVPTRAPLFEPFAPDGGVVSFTCRAVP